MCFVAYVFIDPGWFVLDFPKRFFRLVLNLLVSLDKQTVVSNESIVMFRKCFVLVHTSKVLPRNSVVLLCDSMEWLSQ